MQKQRRKVILALSFMLVLLPGLLFTAAAAQPNGFGLGIILGEPTGLSAKIWTSDHTAVDAALAWSYWLYPAVHFHVDGLWHTNSLIEPDNGFLPLYIGVGGRVKLASGSNLLRLGLRVPFGAEYVFARAPVGLFLELVPIFDVAPVPAGFSWNSAVGIRYYFGS